MDNKKKKTTFLLIILMATTILLIIGTTFAYFSASISSEENAVSLKSAEFAIELKDDPSLLKSHIIPTAEKYVDMAVNRLDKDGNFRKPIEDGDIKLSASTVCIDDYLNEICSVYTFTVQNPMTDIDLPLSVSIVPSVHTFTNLKFKVIERVYTEENGYQVKELMGATPLLDDRYEIDTAKGKYVLNADGEKIEKDNFANLKPTPIPLSELEKTIPRAKDAQTPGEATLSIVLWVDETKSDQTKQDSGKIFAGGIIVNTDGANGHGITGVFSAGGVEKE